MLYLQTIQLETLIFHNQFLILTFIGLNWIDLLVWLIIGQAVLSAWSGDSFIEAFKAIGVYLAILFSFHFYQGLGAFLSIWVPYQKHVLFLDHFHDFIAFCLISAVIFVIFILTRDGWELILKLELDPFLNKLLARIFGVVKAYLLGALFFAALMVTDDGLLGQQARQSISSLMFKGSAQGIYQAAASLVTKTPKQITN